MFVHLTTKSLFSPFLHLVYKRSNVIQELMHPTLERYKVCLDWQTCNGAGRALRPCKTSQIEQTHPHIVKPLHAYYNNLEQVYSKKRKQTHTFLFYVKGSIHYLMWIVKTGFPASLKHLHLSFFISLKKAFLSISHNKDWWNHLLLTFFCMCLQCHKSRM